MDSAEILKLRTMLLFLNRNQKNCTVTAISRILGEEKYRISRLLTEMEKEGLVDKTDPRDPHLTPEGQQKAHVYRDRIEVITDHLMYEGVDVESAQKDAFHWALYNTECSMEAIRKSTEKYRIKSLLRGQRMFGGATLCRQMKDGIYQFPFVVYREKAEGGNPISMADEAFEHPCTIGVEGGEGVLRLRTQTITMAVGDRGEKQIGRIKEVQYYEYGNLIPAEINGNVISIPMSALQFLNLGEGQIFHGSVCLNLQISCGWEHTKTANTVFTVLI